MRLRAAATAGAIAVIAGGGIGYAVSTTGGAAKQVVATSQGSRGNTAARTPSAASTGGVGSSMALPQTGGLTRLFTREANGVDIRGFLVSQPALYLNGGANEPACGTAAPAMQAELSTPDMVAVVSNGPVATGVLWQPFLVGKAEGDQVAVIIVQGGSGLPAQGVGKVRMDFVGGKTDEMTPVQGWSVLAAPVPDLRADSTGQVTFGTLSHVDSSGHVTDAITIKWPQSPVIPAGGAIGWGGSGGGSAGSGTVTPGSVGAASAKGSPPVATDPCQAPPPCTTDPNATPCPVPRPLPAVTTPYTPPSNSPTTPGGSGG